VRVDHRGPDVAVTQEVLDRSHVVVGLQEMAGKAVAQGMGAGSLAELSPGNGPFDGLLDVGLVQMVPSVLTGLGHIGQGLSREEPLPDQSLR
jgi:hypothetical protein